MNLHNLQELLDRGILDEEKLLNELEMTRKQEVLSKHTHAIWYNEHADRSLFYYRLFSNLKN